MNCSKEKSLQDMALGTLDNHKKNMKLELYLTPFTKVKSKDIKMLKLNQNPQNIFRKSSAKFYGPQSVFNISVTKIRKQKYMKSECFHRQKNWQKKIKRSNLIGEK